MLSEAVLWSEPEPPAEPCHVAFYDKRLSFLVANLQEEHIQSTVAQRTAIVSREPSFG